MSLRDDHVRAASSVLLSLGLPRAQHNERSALCLLALLNLSPGEPWSAAESPLLGITPIMDWIRAHYPKEYAPNTRETIRRQTMHQFCDTGIALYNPDNPGRAVNSPRAVYQISPPALSLLRTFGSQAWHDALMAYLADRHTLVAQYARAREHSRVPVEIAPGRAIQLSPGEHSELIRAIIWDFAQRFAPGSRWSTRVTPETNGATSMRLCWRALASSSTPTERCPMWFSITQRCGGSCSWSPSPAMGLWMGSVTLS